MILTSVIKSPRRDKKFRAEFSDGTIVDFGGAGYGDYTTFPAEIRDEKRRLYRLRHRGDRIENVRSAGALSWWILWGDTPDLVENIRAFKKRFKV